jgi:N6-L-threonylcarbamoyladenine synthase
MRPASESTTSDSTGSDISADAPPGGPRPIVRVLGIETSCDETAAAVVENGTTIVSSVVSSQIDLHARYGGVVPELAGRAHVELLTPVLADALAEAGSDHSGRGIDGIAVTNGPGLIGSLLVGVAEAKALSMAWGVPLVGVNHLEAHLFASLLEQPDLGWPLVVLLVSGGHTMLIEVSAPGEYRVMGGTIDDAAGEAFDKVARFIGLGYPGGPAIDRLAPEGDARAFAFPRSTPGDGYDFSFSGLKTSVVNRVRKEPDASTADVAASFQEAVVDVLVARTRRAASDVGARAICLAGGVAANSLLRARIEAACAEDGIGAFLPSRALCTDNAAMVAAAGHWRLTRGDRHGLDLGADPNLRLVSTV